MKIPPMVRSSKQDKEFRGTCIIVLLLQVAEKIAVSLNKSNYSGAN